MNIRIPKASFLNLVLKQDVMKIQIKDFIDLKKHRNEMTFIIVMGLHFTFLLKTHYIATIFKCF